MSRKTLWPIDVQTLRPSKPQTSVGFYCWLPISLVLGTATFLFTYQLGSEGLWLDELTSIEDASANPWQVYRGNQLRPLYYLLLMGWRRFGNSDVWLRSLSVIFALISVFLIYRLGQRLAGEAEGLIAALLLTVSPVFVNHAQETRMYALSLCLGLAGTLFLAEALLTERPRQPKQTTLAGWSLFRLLAIYTVPLNVTLLLPDALLILVRFRRERAVLIAFAKWLLLLLILWSPLVSSVVREASPNATFASHHPSATPPGPGRVIRQLKFLTVWPFRVQESAVAALFYKVFTFFVAGLAGVGLLRKHFRKDKSLALGTWWACAWLILPLIPIVAFSYLSVPIWESRYILFVSPYLFILLAAGVVSLWRRWKIAAIASGVTYLIAAGGGLARYYTVQDRPDYKFNVESIEKHEQPGDAIVWSYHYQKPFKHYYQGTSDVYWRTVQEIETPADIQAWIDRFPTNRSRLWLVMGEPRILADEFNEAITNAYRIETKFNYEQGSQVMLLTPLDMSPAAP